MLYCAQSLKWCPTLCSPMNYSPPGSPVHGIFQARIQEWVAISFPGIKPAPPVSLVLQVDSSPTEPLGPLLCTRMKWRKHGILCLHVFCSDADCPTFFLLISLFLFSSPTPSHILPFTLGKPMSTFSNISLSVFPAHILKDVSLYLFFNSTICFSKMK